MGVSSRARSSGAHSRVQGAAGVTPLPVWVRGHSCPLPPVALLTEMPLTVAGSLSPLI